MMAGGPLTEGLNAISKVAGSLSSVPVIGPICDTASWVTRALSGVASIFGWSKPQNGNVSMIISRQYDRNAATSDGLDPSYPLALISDNKLAMSDELSIRSEDEMSFTFLKAIPTWYNNFTWTTSQTSGTRLAIDISGATSTVVKPSAFEIPFTTATHAAHSASGVTSPPFAFLQRQFALWRGSICVNLKFAKTQFHSGRLQVTFTPYMNTPTLPDLNQSVFALREIVDIRSGDEICFRLPYLINYNYLDNTGNIGTFTVTVLNELRAPPTVSDTVDVMCWVHACEDYELQVPAPGSHGLTPLIPQSGLVVEETIGNMPSKPLNIDYAMQSIGETFTSIKQLLNRWTMVSIRSSYISSGNSLAIWPYFSEAVAVATDTGGLLAPNAGADAFSAFRCLYAFYRGSVRLKVNLTADATPSNPVPAYLCLMPNLVARGTNVIQNSIALPSASSHDYTTGSAYSLIGVAIADAAVGQVSAIAPYLAEMKMSLSIPQFATTNASIANLDKVSSDPSQPIATLSFNALGNFATYALERSCGDDFQFSYFIGVPPLFNSYT